MTRLPVFLALLVSSVLIPAPTLGNFQEEAKVEEYAGRVHAASTVAIRSRVTGLISKVHFKEGEQVKEGQLLFEIDSGPFEADLKRAHGSVKLWGARRDRHEDLVRLYKPLVEKGTVAKEEYLRAIGDLAEAEAGLQAAKADVDAARRQLESTKIRAPISGRIGECLLTAGNLVKADDTSKAMLLTTVVSIDPMHVYFEIDERTALRMMRQAKERKSREIAVAIRLADEKAPSRKGKIDFVDTKINSKTGALRVRAVFDNVDRLLMPGMSVRVRMSSDESK